jgi:hypothetical protein
MKKRLFIGLVVGTMCVGLVGCGGDSSNTGSADNGSSANVSTESESEGDQSMSDILPDIAELYSDKNVSILRNSETSYYASLSSATVADFKTYINQLDGTIFTNQDTYSTTDSDAFARYYDADHKYQLNIGYDTQNGGEMVITCDVIQN